MAEIIRKLIDKVNLFALLSVTIAYIVLRVALRWEFVKEADIAIGSIVIIIVSMLVTSFWEWYKLRHFVKLSPLDFFCQYDKTRGYPLQVHKKGEDTGPFFMVFEEEGDYLWLMPEIRFSVNADDPAQRTEIKRQIGVAIHEGNLTELHKLATGRHHSCTFTWAGSQKPLKIRKDRTEEWQSKKYFICEEI